MTAGARELREWVEQLAAQLERDGLPRMAGRIFAWLLVCEPAEQSMDQLAAALQGSKASMSTMTRLLEGTGLIERVRRPGARTDLFRMPEEKWGSFWEAQLARLRTVTDTLARGAALVSARPAEARRRVEGVLEQYRFLERELPTLLSRWRGGASRHQDLTPARPRSGTPSRRAPARRRDHRAGRA